MSMTPLVLLVLLFLYVYDSLCTSGSAVPLCLWFTLYFWFCCSSVSWTWFVLLGLLFVYNSPCPSGTAVFVCIWLILFFWFCCFLMPVSHRYISTYCHQMEIALQLYLCSWFCCFCMSVTHFVLLVLLFLYVCDSSCTPGSAVSLCLWLTLRVWFFCCFTSMTHLVLLVLLFLYVILFLQLFVLHFKWCHHFLQHHAPIIQLIKCKNNHSLQFSVEYLFPTLLTEHLHHFGAELWVAKTKKKKHFDMISFTKSFFHPFQWRPWTYATVLLKIYPLFSVNS